MGRLLLGGVVFAAAVANDHSGAGTARLLLVLLVVAVVGAGSVVYWMVTRWRIHAGDLQIETGLLRRRSLRFPLERIQAVDVIEPLFARMFGLAEVRVVVAGSGAERGALSYLEAGEARVVRGQLLALAHGLRRDLPEPAAIPVIQMRNERLVTAVLASGPPLIGVLVVVAMIVVALSVPHGIALIGSIFPVGFAVATGVWRSLSTDYNFVVLEAPDGLRLERGLLQVRRETIPFGRIQAIRIVQPFTWRFFGWIRLEVDVARQRRSQREDREASRYTRSLLPVGTPDEARWLLGRTFPGAVTEPPPGTRPPARARIRAPLSYHYLAAWFDDRHIAARTGRVRPDTVLIPLHKVQSVRLRQGPVSRRLGLASIHVDTAGARWQAAARYRDAAEAQQWLERISDLARAARRRAA